MKTNACLAAVLVTLPATSLADGETNPYASIATRNAFGLKAVPAVMSPAPILPPAIRIELNGIVAFPPHKWALLWILEPGRAARLATLKEGSIEGSVEVLAIDVETEQVRVRTGQTERILWLKNGEAPAVSAAHSSVRESEHKPIPIVPPPGVGDP